MKSWFPLLILIIPALSYSQNEKEKLVSELIALSLQGATELKTFHTAFERMIASNDKLNKAQKKRIVGIVQEKMNRQKIEDLYVPIYMGHYSEADLKGLIAFYKSPLGKKHLAADAKIRAELHQVGLSYGQRVLAEIAVEIQKASIPKPPEK